MSIWALYASYIHQVELLKIQQEELHDKLSEQMDKKLERVHTDLMRDQEVA
jgi:hypothetical protein